MGISQQLVSIIIPVRTIDFLLEKCILEIRNFYDEVNIIVIYDEFKENIKLKNIKNITYLQSKNIKMSAKRNQGADYAESKYIAFIDSDAYPTKDWLNAGLKFLEENSEYSAVTGCQYSPPTDTLQQKCLRLLKYSPLLTHKEWCLIINENSEPQDVNEFSSANVILRKTDYINLGGMNETIYLAEDNEFSKRFIENGYKIRFIPQVSIFHRESMPASFYNKLWAMGYYYSNIFIKKKSIKNKKQTLYQFFPLISVLLFIFLWIICLLINKKPYPLLIFPGIAFIILFIESYNTAKKLKDNKFIGFLYTFMYFIIFCFVYIIATLFGFLNINIKSVYDCYKQY